MSTIYHCIDCEGPYCVDCDGGEDHCEVCHTGPRCDDCAAEHFDEHHTNEDEADGVPADLPLCAQAMHCLCAFHARGGDVHAPCDTRE